MGSDVTESQPTRWRRWWALLMSADRRVSQLADRVWRWLLCQVLRRMRAAAAGSGTLAWIWVLLWLLAGRDEVSTYWVLGVLLAGAALGVAAQHLYKRVTFLRRVEEMLSRGIGRIADDS